MIRVGTGVFVGDWEGDTEGSLETVGPSVVVGSAVGDCDLDGS